MSDARVLREADSELLARHMLYSLKNKFECQEVTGPLSAPVCSLITRIRLYISRDG